MAIRYAYLQTTIAYIIHHLRQKVNIFDFSCAVITKL